METASDVREEEFLWQSRDAGASPKEFQAGTCPPPPPVPKKLQALCGPTHDSRLAARRLLFFPAERWEIYIRGVEVANAYGELIDPVEQEKRFRKYNQKRRENGLSEYPEATEFLEAIRYGIPASSGCALGFDRIVMLLFGAKSLDEVTYPR